MPTIIPGSMPGATSVRKSTYFALECTYRHYLTTGSECYARHCINKFVDLYSIEAAFLHFGDLESTGQLSLLYLKLCEWFK